MADKRYLVSCKTPEISTQSVVAASCEIHGEHPVLLNAQASWLPCFCWRLLEAGP
jgi:hypothetical protein